MWNHQREHRAAECLAATKHECNHGCKQKELGGLAWLDERIGRDHNRRPDQQAAKNGAFGSDPRGEPTKSQCAKEGHKLHHEDGLNKNRLFELELFRTKLRCQGNHRLNAIVI